MHIKSKPPMKPKALWKFWGGGGGVEAHFSDQPYRPRPKSRLITIHSSIITKISINIYSNYPIKIPFAHNACCGLQD